MVEGQTVRQVLLLKKYPLEQVRHRVEELMQVRQLPVQATQELSVVLRKVEEGQVLTHCLLYKMPVMQVMQRYKLWQFPHGVLQALQVCVWSSPKKASAQMLTQTLLDVLR